MDNSTKDLLVQFSRLNTQDERVDFLEKVLMGNSPTAEELRLPPTPDAAKYLPKKKENPDVDRFIQQIPDLCARHGLEYLMANRVADGMLHGLLPTEEKWSHTITRLPCANIQPGIHKKCPETGIHACSGCLLVSYCSKECQKSHWSVHKSACKHPLNSKAWTPIWMKEKRQPIFIKSLGSDSDMSRSEGHNPVGCGRSLWGNIPAIDILNLEKNEGLLYKQDLSLAFVASGDIRNVVTTINSIPAGYGGKIFVAINDLESQVLARNLLLLLAISGVKKKEFTADVALHLWYSAFIPEEYHNRIVAFSKAALSTISKVRVDWKDDNGLRIICDTNPLVSDAIATYLDPRIRLDAKNTHQQYVDMMYSPGRVDYHDRYYCKLKPAHRLAMRQFRNSGIVLPFGATDTQFNTPNITLFTKHGEWLQDDANSPLSGWNLVDVVATGKVHGAREEDIFGCLYFYLTEKLVEFKEKLSSLDITFYLSSINCRDLAANIKDLGTSSTGRIPLGPYPPGLPIKFDRIDVSNTVDDVYVGYEDSLVDWGPLLNESNPHSTLLAYSMNWPSQCNGGMVTDDEATSEQIMEIFIRQKIGIAAPTGVSVALWATISELKCADATPVMYDNSKAFDQYLWQRKVSKIAANLGLQMQSKHTITPPRHGVSLDAPMSALPNFPEEDVWYTEVYLSGYSFYTRFHEFRRSST